MSKKLAHREMLKDFFAGALIANAPMWILVQIIYNLFDLNLRESRFTSALILNLGTMICGILAGSLVERKTRFDARRVGIIVGGLSYLIFAIFLTIIGFRGEMIEETSSLTGFLIGSAIGSKIGKNLSS
ncbi:hypothetical protein DRO56_05950 [Candidatus Bathyarchaeota archaeon]|nr:MAG: hypothetical protein DRO56_05950 [Candidatus Bathyarchaeota archaeon]